MATPGALKALLKALNAEQALRRKAQFGGHDDPRQWLIDTLQQMAQRLVAPSLHPLDIADLSVAEKVACLLLPEPLRPAGLPTEAAIWAEFEALRPPGA